MRFLGDLSISLVAQLVDPFLHHSTCLRTSEDSTFLPLLRPDCDHYLNDRPAYSLDTFESLNGSSGVQNLLPKVAQRNGDGSNGGNGRDLRVPLALKHIEEILVRVES